MGLFRKSDRDVFGVGAAIFALLAVLFAFAAMFVAANKESTSASSSSGGTQVSLSEFKIEPSSLTVSPGGSLVVTNNGTVAHNFSIQGTSKATKQLNPGQSETLSLSGLKAGSYTVFCSVPGHESAGMKGTLIIGSGGAVQASSQSGTSGASAQELLSTNAANDKTQGAVVTKYAGQLTKLVQNYVKTGQIDPALYDPNTSYGKDFTAMGGNPLLGPPVLKPEVQADGTKLFKLDAKVVQWEISPGNKVSAYTYNGMVPGPTMIVNPGDKVAVEMKNDLPQSTALHFHGIDTPVGMDGVPFVTQDPVKPKETFTYTFTATSRPQVGMYHSHYHAEHQIADGMAGAFIVGATPIPSSVAAQYPKSAQFPAADTPYIMMLNDSGSIGLALNGKAFPGTSPVVTPVGKWIEIDYMNEGETVHPMHLHGITQLVIAKDGAPLPAPYTADVVLVAPGERYTVLVKPDASNLDNLKQTPFAPFGVWAFHCHIIAHAESNNGFIGMTTTFIALPS
ncbi:MAG: multicopper oxidase domain-containing protein [Acidimicrobiia bacterium]